MSYLKRARYPLLCEWRSMLLPWPTAVGRRSPEYSYFEVNRGRSSWKRDRSGTARGVVRHPNPMKKFPQMFLSDLDMVGGGGGGVTRGREGGPRLKARGGSGEVPPGPVLTKTPKLSGRLL